MIKKVLLTLTAIVMLGMSSCTTTKNTATTQDFSSATISATLADLEVSPRKITYVYHPTSDVRRGGEDNVINTAIREALKQNGGGDILVELQTTVKKYRGLFTTKISEVTVSGYPATYTNFRPVDTESLKEGYKNHPNPQPQAQKRRVFGLF
ncbi:MAG: hypothetical protein IJT30_01160 [Muribaculaceae bacterium]|nr:hypothetical protein [Muribaculaceae bacterium]